MRMKGMMFSASAFLLLIGIFSLATAFSLYSIKLNEEVNKNSAMDKVFYEFESIQDILRKVFYTESGVNISTKGNNVTFEENLPQNSTTWQEDLTEAELFIKNYSVNNVNLDLSSVKSQLVLNITPGIIFKHTNYGDKNFQFQPSVSLLSPRKFEGYDIYIDVGGLNIPPGKCKDSFVSNTTTTDYILVCVYLKGSPMSCDLGCRYLNPNAQSIANIVTAGNYWLNFTFNESGKYTFVTNRDLYAKNTLILRNIEERIRVTYPLNIIQADFTDFSVWKNDTVYLYKLPN